jgi:hypothetical protein
MTLPLEPVPNNEALRRHLTALRDSLITLHKALIDSERAAYEQTFGRIESPNRLLQLLIKDPWFVWLHPLSQVVISIDGLLEADEPLTSENVLQITDIVREMLKSSEAGQGFPRSYFEALQREPEVVLAHAEVVQHLKKRLPGI